MASKPKAAAKKPTKKKNGYEAPKKLKIGTLLRDSHKKEWKIGVSIGVGGFGEIYSAHEASSAVKKVDDYPYVVKIEPHNNGPLFVEMHFYMRVGKKEDIDTFAKSKKLTYLGMPYLVGSGSEEIESLKHRFLVMPRYGSDIWKIFLQQDRKFPLHTVYRIGWQLTNILEYIHTSGYVHMDIKGANILLGFDKKNGGEEHINLLDFGLACHFTTKEYKNDPKKAHNGTIEYTSRDAHNGVPTIRGDFEVLAYNLIEWAGAKLPWTASQQILNKPIEVQKMKEEFMKTIDKSLKSAFGTLPVPSPLTVFIKYMQALKYDTKPDYKKIRDTFETGLKEEKQKNSGKLEFLVTSSSSSKPGTSGVQKVTAAKSPQKRTAAPAVKDDLKKAAVKKAKVEEDEPIARSKRVREKKTYFDSESEDEIQLVKSKKPSPKKVQKNKPTPEKNENTSANQPEKKKNEKDDKKKSAEAVGKVVLKSKSTSSKKTVQLNFDLDISFDSDLVVTVNRKDKKKKSNEEEKEEKNKTQAGYYKGKYAKT